jgi:ADP-L-glycero-D-manno-heptose 6-epimerase
MYIVTGGAGFIGSAVIWKLNQMGIDNILIVDHLGHSDKWKNLRALSYHDYMEKDVFRKCIAENRLESSIDAIIHMGACSSTTETDASYLIDNNLNYSKELAKFAVSREIRFIYASSAATYGDGSHGYIDFEDNINILRPLNMYGHSKQMFDQWVQKNGLFRMLTGLKFTNIYGPNETHKGDMRSVINKAFKQITETGKVKLFKSYHPDYADGEQKRDFLYVKDAVDMILFFLERYDGGLFNIGSGRAETWNSLIKAVFSAMGEKSSIDYIDMPEHLRDKYQYYTKAEMSKLKNLGYKTKIHTLKNGIKDYVQNYLMQDKHLGDEA